MRKSVIAYRFRLLLLTFIAALKLLLMPETGLSQHMHTCSHSQTHRATFENPLEAQYLSAYDIKGYRLSLEVSNRNTKVSGDAIVIMEVLRSLDTLVLELQDGLDVSRVAYSDSPGSYVFPEENELLFEHRDRAIYIAMDRVRDAGELTQVQVTYSGDAGGDGGFFSGVSNRKYTGFGGFDVTYTLSEPHNALEWFPVKQVLSDKIDSLTMRFTCNKNLMVGSNGLLVDVAENGTKHTFTWKSAYPTAYYLLSFSVADYRDYSYKAGLSSPGDSVLVQNFIYDSDEAMSTWKDGIDETGKMLTFFSKLLTDYPFAEEKYGHCVAPIGGGMEHQTMTTINDFNFYLVAHELAHQWFGDHVTCANWQDIWINEGFASYMEYVAAAYLRGAKEATAWMEQAMSLAKRAPTGSVFVPEEDVMNDSRLFSYSLSYKKGATLLHMIRFILDDDATFYRTMSTYLEAYGDGGASAEDFRGILENESGMDFSDFFEQWYYGEGYPYFHIAWEQTGDSLGLYCEERVSAPEVTPFFKLPFEVELYYAGGERERFRLNQDESYQEFFLHVDDLVLEIHFDPDMHLLANSKTIQKTDMDRPYRFGPNPTDDQLLIQFPGEPFIQEIRLSSMAGRELMILQDLSNPYYLDMAGLPGGTYLLEMTTQSSTHLESIVKLDR